MDLSPSMIARPFLVPLMEGQNAEMAAEPSFVIPAGTVTFVLTDIEGSTRLWHERADEMGAAVARHYGILDEAIVEAGGVRPVEQGEGDSVVGAFARASDAIVAALAAQRRLIEELPWLPVRMAVHTGEAQLRDEGNYVGRAIIRCARLRACAHGRQVLVSETAAALAIDDFPDGVAVADLGVARLRDLTRSERVFQLLHADLPSAFPPLRSLDSVPNNLPTPLTTFIGRERELGTVCELLASHRLVTLTGSGGSGKTRLALHTAADVVGRYPGGTWWVELAPAATIEQVADRILLATGLAPSTGVDGLDQAIYRLRSQEVVLLVLDNAEHLIGEVATVVDRLLAECPRLHVLATSREPLGVPGELVWRVPSLAIPQVAEQTTMARLDVFDAVRLFVDRARLARPNLAIDDRAAPFIASICARLDGIPLAIELAAARARTLSLERLASGLDDAFRMLSGGARTLLPRQQTLLASIAWSVDLLEQRERAVLFRLAVFQSSFTLDAAEAIAAEGDTVDEFDVLELLGRLVDKSLVELDDSNGRYRLLETIRQFGLDRLRSSGELVAVRAAYARFWARWSNEAGAGRHGISLELMRPDLPDLFVALEWAYLHSPVDAYEICSGMRWVRPALGYFSELARQCDWIATGGHDQHPVEWARAAAATISAGFVTGRFELAALEPQILAALPRDDIDTRKLIRSGPATMKAMTNGDRAEYTELAEYWSRSGNEPALAYFVGSLSVIAAQSGAFDETERWLGKIRPVLARHGLPFDCDSSGQAWAGALLACAYRGEFDAARALTGGRIPQDAFFSFTSASVLAGFAFMSGDDHLLSEAQRWIDREAPVLFRPVRDIVANYEVMMRGGDLDLAADRSISIGEAYATFPGSVARLYPVLNLVLFEAGRVEAAERHVEIIERAVTALVDSAPLPRAAAHQLRAQLELHRGDDDRALDSTHQMLELAEAHGFVLLVVDALELLAVLADRRGSVGTRDVLAAAARAARLRTGYIAGMLPTRPLRDELAAVPLTTAEAPDLRNAVEYARRSRGERGRPSHGWASLTPTEHRVIELVADGLSNAAIATRLLMSSATVKSHLSHVFTKLAVGNRTSLANEVIRRR